MEKAKITIRTQTYCILKYYSRIVFTLQKFTNYFTLTSHKVLKLQTFLCYIKDHSMKTP